MQQIGTYVLERELGGGALGTVHLARTAAGRAVAVKVLRLGATPDTADDRLRAAVEAARSVGGFHTAPVLDADTCADTLWFATPYVPGPSLAEVLASRGPLGEDDVRRLGLGVADALRSVHVRGLVHGDLKATDVLMADDGPRLRDFGLRPVDGDGAVSAGADDVRALGALLVTAGGGDLSALPESLRAAVQTCLDEDPVRRPTPDGLLAALAPQAPAAQVPPPPAPYGPPVGQPPVPAQAPAPPSMPPNAPAQTPSPYAAPPPHAAHAGQMPTAPPQGGFGPAAPMAPPARPGPSGPPEQPHPGGAPHGAPPAPDAPAGPGVAGEEPEFLAMDRRNDIVADAHGVSFSAYGRSTDLAWQHIRFAQHRRDAQGSQFVLTLVLHVTNGTQAVCRVSTRNAWEVEQWAAQLDTVLARFLPRR